LDTGPKKWLKSFRFFHLDKKVSSREKLTSYFISFFAFIEIVIEVKKKKMVESLICKNKKFQG